MPPDDPPYEPPISWFLEPGGTYSAPRHRVYLRPSWLSDWTHIPGLFCDWCYFGCGEEVSRAQLTWEYGHAWHPGQPGSGVYGTQDLIDHYVRVEIEQGDGLLPPILWYGIITEVCDRQRGSGQQGTQAIVCHGLELLLDRAYVVTSWCQGFQQDKYLVRRGIRFNSDRPLIEEQDLGENTKDRFGNRSSVVGPDGVYLFSMMQDRELWSSKNVLEYLVKYHMPKAASGVSVVGWQATRRALDTAPDWDTPVVDVDGKKVRQILNELFDRRRLLSWRVIVEATGDPPVESIFIDVFSFNSAEISMPSGKSQPANEETFALNYDKNVDVVDSRLQSSTAHRVDRVICRGARRRSCVTLSAADNTLIARWATADETRYQDGPGGLPTDWLEKRNRIRQYRKEDHLKHVYTHFSVPSPWNWRVPALALYADVFPWDKEIPTDYVFDLERPFKRKLFPGLIKHTEVANEQYAAAEPQAWIRYFTGDDEVDRYQQVEKLDSPEASFSNAMPLIDFTCSLRMHEYLPVVIVKAQGSQIWDHEAIAKADFTGNTGVSGVDAYTPVLDWREMYVTVMAEAESRVTRAWPPLEEFEEINADVARVLYVDLGDRYRFDYAPAGTVIGVKDGILQRLDELKYFRDDREKLEDIARMVYDWYSAERHALTLTVRRIDMLAPVGTIITTVDRGGLPVQVNTPVTGVHLDLVRVQMTITTSFAELDPLQL